MPLTACCHGRGVCSPLCREYGLCLVMDSGLGSVPVFTSGDIQNPDEAGGKLVESSSETW
jgi:hypothetical protein